MFKDIIITLVLNRLQCMYLLFMSIILHSVNGNPLFSTKVAFFCCFFFFNFFSFFFFQIKDLKISMEIACTHIIIIIVYHQLCLIICRILFTLMGSAFSHFIYTVRKVANKIR